MKKITLILFVLISAMGFSQNIVIDGDFESGSAGPNWTGNGGGANVIDDGTGNFVNSALVGAAAESWQTSLQQVVALTQDESYELTFDAYIDAGTADILIGIGQNGGSFAGPAEIISLTSTSTTFTSTFVAGFDTVVNGSRVYFDMASVANEGITVIIDNISLVEVVNLCNDGIMNNGETEIDCGGPNCDACPSPPMVAAPTPPTLPASDVVSIYNDTPYASIPGINYDAGFCDTGAVTEISVAGDNVLRYNERDCQGIDFSANTQDITGFTNLHVDIFVQAGTDLVGKVFNLIVVGPEGAGQDTVVPIDLNDLTPAPVPGTWYSYDMPVTFNATTIRQFTVVSNLKNIVWYDNLYLYNATALSTNDFAKTSFSVFPNPSQSSWTVKTESINMSSIKVFDVLGKNVLSLTPNATDTVIDGSNLKAGLYFAQIKTESGINSIKLIKK